MNEVIVPVKSAWTSKINWTQAVQAVAMVLTLVSGGKFNLTGEEQAAIITVIGIAGNVFTVVLKTFYTSTVTPSSIAPPSSLG